MKEKYNVRCPHRWRVEDQDVWNLKGHVCARILDEGVCLHMKKEA